MLPASSLLLLLPALLGATAHLTVNTGASLTLPAQRHLVRVQVEPTRAIWLLAVQRDGAQSQGLVMLRSDDEARTFLPYASIQSDVSERSTAELLVVGRDVAMVHSYEGPTLTGSTRHDVFFQWWRYQPATGQFTPEPAIRIFDSTTNTSAFSRAELVRDSLGRFWVQAFRLNAGGTSTAVIALSTDEGASFRELPALDTVPARGGGRMLSLGSSIVFVYGMHDGTSAGRMRLRRDEDPVESWGPVTFPFPEGLYHGAALSAVATPGGGMHFVYKANDERLYYRYFDGTSFGTRQLVDGSPDWALQAATTLIGDTLFIFYNHKIPGTTNHDFRSRKLVAGALTAEQVLDSSAGFKGYPNAAETLPPGIRAVPCFYSATPDANSGGQLVTVEVAAPGGTTAPPPPPALDAGVITPPPVVDAGVVIPPPPTPSNPTLLFEDLFSRRTPEGLGAQWTTLGLWLANNAANSDLHGEDRATENVATCLDCRVEARVIGFGVPITALFVRAPNGNSTDRYQLALLGNGRLQIQRVRAGVTQSLGEVASGLRALNEFSSLALSVSGTVPVSLDAFVNGVARLAVVDASPQALVQPGYAGMYTTRAGVVFDDFRLYGIGGSTPALDAGAPPPVVDAGVPPPVVDAGAPPSVFDAGVPLPPPSSGTLTVAPIYTDKTRRVLAVTTAGAVIGTTLSDTRTLLISVDGARTWAPLGRHPANAPFWTMTTLSNGTLLADVIVNGQHLIARSTDGGKSWTDTLNLGKYRTLTPHSFAELDGVTYVLEYQTFTGAATTNRLWASNDSGASWSIRFTFTASRHGHGLAADPARHALWAFFGDTDPQAMLLRSTNGGSTWSTMLRAQPGDIVDATVLSDGTLLFGQDISYLPPTPHIARITPGGVYTEHIRLSGPSYSIHAIRGGGFVVGATREPGGDVYLPGEVSAHLYTSPDGVRWTDALKYPRLSATELTRADIYWALPTGELIVEFDNVAGMGAGGKGFQLLRVTR